MGREEIIKEIEEAIVDMPIGNSRKQAEYIYESVIEKLIEAN